jgi:glycosyltransferase involved in cell wall biosynthesis
VKVAVVFYGLGPEGGGVHTFQRSLLATLRETGPASGHEFVYYTAGGGDEPGVIAIPAGRGARVRRRGLEVVREAYDRFNVPRRSAQTWFERSLDEHGIDFVWFAANWAEESGRPFLFTLFDLAHLVQPHFPEVSTDGEWERRHTAHFARWLPRASGVIVPNAAGRDQLVRHFAVEDERILCLGHPTPDFALEPERFGCDESVLERHGIGRPYLLYPAQFWAHKNHYGLLRALALLEGYELVLVGSDKGLRDHVRGLVDELGLAGRVHLLGFVEISELIGLYRGAHALVYLTFLGPENLPPLEAFALDCPVVASAVPGAAEQLGDAALLVGPTDPQAAANAVRALEDPAERERRIALGRQRAGQLTQEAYVQGVLDYLDAFEPIRRCWP